MQKIFKTRKRMMLLFLCVFTFVSVFVSKSDFFFSLKDNISALQEVSTFDDGPKGEKIVDFKCQGSWTGFPCAFKTENNQMYTYSSYHSNPRPKKVEYSDSNENGEVYLSDVEEFWVSTTTSNAELYFVKTKDQKLYYWGTMFDYDIFKNAKTNVPVKSLVTDKAVEIQFQDSSFQVQNIKDIKIAVGHSGTPFKCAIIFNNGEIYVFGNNTYKDLAVVGASKLDTLTKFSISNYDIVDIDLSLFQTMARTSDGKILLLGSGYTYTNAEDIPLAKNESGGELQNIKKVHMGEYGGSAIAIDQENNVYATSTGINDVFTKVEWGKPIANDPYFDFSGDFLSYVGKDKKFYVDNSLTSTYYNYGYSLTSKMNPIIENLAGLGYGETETLPKDYKGGLKVYRRYGNETIALTENGGVFIYGQKLTFGAINVSAVKTDDSAYQNKEKYNDSITLKLKKTTADNSAKIKYIVTDLNTNTVAPEEELIDDNKIEIPLQEGERIYRQYDFFLEELERDTKVSFIVDLYKKTMTLPKITGNKGSFPKGSVVYLGDNGLSGNQVTATITGPQFEGSESSVNYNSEPLNTPGEYTIVATDAYGNTGEFQITITDGVAPNGIIFTQSASPLVYDTLYTKTNGAIGSVKLTYPETEELTGKIKTISLAEDSPHRDKFEFDVVSPSTGADSVALKVKTDVGNVPVGRYENIKVKGTDTDDKPFTGTITFEIVRAQQSMDWDQKTIELSKNEVSVGQSNVSVGVINVKEQEQANIQYSIDPSVNGVKIDPKTGELTITSIPKSEKITVKATANQTPNYNAKVISIDIPVKLKAVELEIQMDDANIEGENFVNELTIKLGSKKPIDFKIVTKPDLTLDLSSINYVFKKDGQVVNDPQNKPGLYTVEVEGLTLDGYSITWIVGRLTVEEVEVTDDWYTLTIEKTNDKYTEGTWTNKNVVITPKHQEFNKVQINDGRFNTTASVFETEGDNTVKLTFQNSAGVQVSKTINIKIDKTKPVVNQFVYTKINLNVFQKLWRAITFNQTYKGSHTVTFSANDSLSGVKQLEYTIEKIAENAKVKESRDIVTGANGSATLEPISTYKITVIAEDNAGNKSDSRSETVKIEEDKVTPEPEGPNPPNPGGGENGGGTKPPVNPDGGQEGGGNENGQGGETPQPPEPPRPPKPEIPEGGGDGEVQPKPPTPPQPPKPDQGGNEEIKPPKPDKDHCVPGPDGKPGTADDVCGTGKEPEKPHKDENGNVIIPPGGGSVIFPDKEIEVPGGTIIHPDGSVTLPDGTELDPNGNKKPGKVCPNDGTDINVDTNGDGKPDLNIDTNGDCKPDVNIDSNGDKKPDINVDTNGDGKPDVNIDSDGDGNPDVNVDINCDGDADINIDTDGDGIPNINIDTTGDGKPNYNVDRNNDGRPDLNVGPVKWKTDKCGITECGTKYCTSSYYEPVLNIDTDNDGRPDVNLDLDEDGYPEINIDIDKDGIPDINIDINGDGKADINIDKDGNGWPDENLAIIESWKSELNFNIKDLGFDTMSGIQVDSNLTPENWHPSGQGNNSNNGNNHLNGGSNTGDSTNLWWLWILFILSLFTSIYCYYKQRKDKQEVI